jgi:hypothetical protein
MIKHEPEAVGRVADQLRSASLSIAAAGLVMAYMVPGVERLFRGAAMRCFMGAFMGMLVSWLLIKYRSRIRWKAAQSNLPARQFKWWQRSRFWDSSAGALLVVGWMALVIGIATRH